MRSCIVGAILLLLTASCGNKANREASLPLSPSESGSQADSATAYVAVETESWEADDSFDDFIYNFAIDQELQCKRIKFPIPCLTGKETKQIEESHWLREETFPSGNYYTLLFDKEKDMDMANDTSLHSVYVEWISMKEQRMKRFHFKRTKGMWMMDTISVASTARNGSDGFIRFFHHFASDSLFQARHVADPLAFVTLDPDDDFSILETTIDRGQWFSFKPELPTEYLANINYGQPASKYSRTKILALKGLGNGFSNVLYFRHRKGEWELYKFEDTSI